MLNEAATLSDAPTKWANPKALEAQWRMYLLGLASDRYHAEARAAGFSNTHLYTLHKEGIGTHYPKG